jgi:hypothetical protein
MDGMTDVLDAPIADNVAWDPHICQKNVHTALVEAASKL